MRTARLVLAAAAAVLATTGGVVALTLAGAAPASPFTVTGGSLRAATGTPAPPSGTHASLWGNSSTAAVTLEGSGRVVVGAIGDECEGWPTLEARVDGVVVGRTTIVDAARYGSYAVGRAVGAGRHAVVLAFVNDRRTAACDRNVHVGFARMETAGIPAPGTPTPTTPAPGGRPGPGTTGVPAGTALTVHEGDLTVRTPGTVIDALDIRGNLKIQADDVTVRRTLIRGRYVPGPRGTAIVAAWSNQKRFVIEDSTIRAQYPSAVLNGLQGYDFTARRLDVSNVVDTAVIFGDNVTITDSWFHDTSYYTPFPAAPDNQTHNDNLQIEGGTNILVRGNVFEEAHNAAIMVTQNYARTSNVRVTGNWLSGGGCTVNLSEKGKGPILGFRLSGNRFGPSAVGNCAVIAPPTSDVTLDGDVWDATGTPVSVRRGG